MLGAADRAYYRRRAIEERQMAERAVHMHAQAAHAEMARAYELRIAVEHDIGRSKCEEGVSRSFKPAIAGI